MEVSAREQPSVCECERERVSLGICEIVCERGSQLARERERERKC